MKHEDRLHPQSAGVCALGHEARDCTYLRWRNSCPGGRRRSSQTAKNTPRGYVFCP